MQIIINLSDEVIERLANGSEDMDDAAEIIESIAQGIPLDDLRTEIEEKYGDYDICEWFEDYDYEENDISEYRSVGDVSDILAIIDKYKREDVISQLRANRDRPQEAIKALGDDLRKCQKSIIDDEVLMGFNMAVAICNKHLAESEDKE